MKSYRILLYLAALAVTTGCANFLDKTPLVDLNAENYYSTEQELNDAAMGIYAVMQQETFQIGHYMILGDACSDDADLGNSRSEAYSWLGGAAKDCQNFSLLANNGQSGGLWNLAWTMINSATQLIVNGEKSEIENADRYIGEAYFLRAFAYFNLVTQYGRMPIVDHILEYEEYYMPRPDDVSTTWTFIEDDLKAAIKRLPEAWDAENEGRVTKGAAMSMLGRTYVYQCKWQEAHDILEDVILAGYYQLEPVYEDIFSMEHENGIECIFAIQHMTSGTGWSDSNEGSILEFYEHDAGLTQADIDSGKYPGEEVYEKWEVGWSMHCPTLDLYNAFEEGDPRREATIIEYKEDYDGHIHYNLSSDNGLQSKKYYVPYDYRSKEDQSDLPKNIIILRYADVLLYMAEACNELGDSDGAVNYLEMVRSRARNCSDDPANTLAKIEFSSKEQMRQAIWDERRVELAMEYQRFWDLARQHKDGTLNSESRVGDVMQNYYKTYGPDGQPDGYVNVRGDQISPSIKGENFTKGKNEIWPIPTAAITASNGTMEQNPYY